MVAKLNSFLLFLGILLSANSTFAQQMAYTKTGKSFIIIDDRIIGLNKYNTYCTTLGSPKNLTPQHSIVLTRSKFDNPIDIYKIEINNTISIEAAFMNNTWYIGKNINTNIVYNQAHYRFEYNGGHIYPEIDNGQLTLTPDNLQFTSLSQQSYDCSPFSLLTPNPTNDIFDIELDVNIPVLAQISIIDNFGVPVYNNVGVSLTAGINLIPFDLSTQQPGLYNVIIQAGTDTYTATIQKL